MHQARTCHNQELKEVGLHAMEAEGVEGLGISRKCHRQKLSSLTQEPSLRKLLINGLILNVSKVDVVYLYCSIV